MSWISIEKLNQTQHASITKYNKEKTKAWFGRFTGTSAWKWNGPILEQLVSQEVNK